LVRLEADVLIVGGGIIGCAVARELSARGCQVVVVEARDLALGATRASAGVLAPYIEAHEGGPLLELTLRSLALYDQWIEAVRAGSGGRLEYRRSGSLEVAQDAGAAERLQEVARRYGAQGSLGWLDGGAVRAMEPALSPDAIGALSVPAHGYVAAEALTVALAQAASSHGAVFHARVRIDRIEPFDERVRVASDDGRTWDVERVIVAAGSWSGLVESPDPAAAHVRPVRGQLLRVAWRGAPLTQVIWGESCYMVPWQDGTVLLGATSEDVGYEERTTAAGIRSLLDAARTLVPAFDDATFVDARAGLRPRSSDGLPLIGASAHTDRLIYATGHYRNGILLAPLTAALVANVLLDGGTDPALATLAPSRLKPEAEAFLSE
jgi:glycine oxidase